MFIKFEGELINMAYIKRVVWYEIKGDLEDGNSPTVGYAIKFFGVNGGDSFSKRYIHTQKSEWEQDCFKIEMAIGLQTNLA